MADSPLRELLNRQMARFVDRQGDWDAFADARVEGYRRAHDLGEAWVADTRRAVRHRSNWGGAASLLPQAPPPY